ncbi:hypothetical protein MJD09_12535, partial [bacterium]|nr:hypothetical protein [bacterium]
RRRSLSTSLALGAVGVFNVKKNHNERGVGIQLFDDGFEFDLAYDLKLASLVHCYFKMAKISQ